ncbi:MAG: hypothetical protein ACRDFB_02070 [Rhabdochlamydiaceae bacterium]
MGNRAVITVEGSNIGIYLHWNGGPESVQAFLRVAKALKVRDPIGDPSYFYARMTQIIANFFGGNMSVGVNSLDSLDCDNCDNGMYIIGADFKIVKQKYTSGKDKKDKKHEDAVYNMALKANYALFNTMDNEAISTLEALLIKE